MYQCNYMIIIIFHIFHRASKQAVAVDVFRHRELKWVEMLQNWDKWITKKFPKVGFGSKCKTNVKNVRTLQYRGVHVHVCGISRWSQYAATEEKK